MLSHVRYLPRLQAILAYQGAAIGSRLFITRLIELVSRSIHQIAVEISLLDESFHETDGLLSWTPPKTDDLFWLFSPDGPLPTWFNLEWYQDYKQYPKGSNDMIGYWAENFIIGGILLFDRRVQVSPSSRRLAGEADVSRGDSKYDAIIECWDTIKLTTIPARFCLHSFRAPSSDVSYLQVIGFTEKGIPRLSAV